MSGHHPLGGSANREISTPNSVTALEKICQLGALHNHHFIHHIQTSHSYQAHAIKKQLAQIISSIEREASIC